MSDRIINEFDAQSTRMRDICDRLDKLRHLQSRIESGETLVGDITPCDG